MKHWLSILWRMFYLCCALAACTARISTSTPTVTSIAPTTSSITTAGTSSQSRFGTFKIEPVQSSGVSGTFTAQDNGDGTTSLSIQITQTAGLYPWGIYDVGDCTNGAPTNTKPVFILPDIEGGHKEETVETPVYESVPGNLIVIVYGIAADGSGRMVACTDLGPPSREASTSVTPSSASATEDCSDTNSRGKLEAGTWLAFSASKNSNADIYLLNVGSTLQAKGSAIVKRLTSNPAADFDPTWSPDSTRIAFRSQRDGNDEIYLMNVDGTCQVNLTSNPVNDWSPAWSPDGKRIAFARFFDGNPYTDIAVINVDGTGFQRLTDSGGEYPAWSPDGKRLAFASAHDGNYEIYFMNADGTDQTRLTDNPAYDMSPAWSADGTRIVYDTQRDHSPPVEVGIGPEFEIHVINSDGSDDNQLTNNQQEDRFPAWSPDGWIAFSRDGALFIMRPDGSEQRQVFESGTFPAWKPLLPVTSP